MVKARQVIKLGDWEKGDRLITAAQKIDNSPNLSYSELRVVAKIRRFQKKTQIWLGRLIKSNSEQ